MTPTSGHVDLSPPLGGRLSAVAITLFCVFIATVLGQVLPLQLLDPVWQLKFAGALINNAPLALVGLAFLHVATRLEPGNPLLAERLSTLARLAQITALGFLLLVPLQLMAVGQTLKAHQNVQNRQLIIAERRIADVRRAINGATTVGQLQAELVRLKVGTLTVRGNPADGSLSGVREKLLSSLEGSRSTLQSQYRSSGIGRIWDLIQLSLQGIVSASALALGFAALGQRRGSPISLLEEFRRRSLRVRFRWPSFRRRQNRDARRLWKQP